ncbi:hypothetical protein DM01DRAFT_1406705 [Hesseltinella vesiculosa]|uniref:Galactose oxidase n=1 Tax=Hesseltinella vesiculosa TaxID=101127 RepID=A0A1X2GLJ6_9FUNG|nr:hypothetical protein DM01DRAFT_1406705 [Hesseltinella vesiculosa]
MLHFLFFIWITLVYGQQPCNISQLQNYSDFSIAYQSSFIYLSGGNPAETSLWRLNLRNGLNVSCLPWEELQPVDTFNIIQPYMYGISFETLTNDVFIQAGDSLISSSSMDAGILYNTSANSWVQVQSTGNSPSVRAEMTATMNTTSHQAWYYGGRNTQAQQHQRNFNYYNDFYAFDTTDSTWIWPNVNYNGGVRPARYGHTANLIQGQLFILGGKTAMINATTNTWIVDGADFRSVLVFDTISYNAISMATIGNIPQGLARFSAVNSPDGRSIVIFGGKVLDSVFTPTQDVYVLDSCTLSWSRPNIQGQPPSARAGHEAIAYGQYMIVIGGIVSVQATNTSQQGIVTYAQDFGILDLLSWTWVPSIPTNYSPSTVQQTPACRFDMPNYSSDSTSGNNGDGLPYDSTVVSNPYGQTSTALKEGLGITFGLLGVLLLGAAAWYVRRMRKNARAINPRWLGGFWKQPSSASSTRSTRSSTTSACSSIPPLKNDNKDPVPLVHISQHA